MFERVAVSLIVSLSIVIAIELRQWRANAATEPARTVLAPIEMPAAEAAFDRPVGDFSIRGSSLAQAVDLVRQCSGANIDVWWGAIPARNTPVDVELRGVTVGGALRAILNSVGGRICLGELDGVIIIAGEEQVPGRMFAWDVRDLIDAIEATQPPTPKRASGGLFAASNRRVDEAPLERLAEMAVRETRGGKQPFEYGLLTVWRGRLVLFGDELDRRRASAALDSIRATVIPNAAAQDASRPKGN